MTQETFTQPKITGYRQLSAEEAAMINVVKRHGADLAALIAAVKQHVALQRSQAGSEENNRITEAQPERWIAIAGTHFQEGLMALARAVAQPEGF